MFFESKFANCFLLNLRWLHGHLHTNLNWCVGVVNISDVINYNIGTERYIDTSDNKIVQNIHVATNTKTRAEKEKKKCERDSKRLIELT